jgi:hypothetical protein
MFKLNSSTLNGEQTNTVRDVLFSLHREPQKYRMLVSRPDFESIRNSPDLGLAASSTLKFHDPSIVVSNPVPFHFFCNISDATLTSLLTFDSWSIISERIKSLGMFEIPEACQDLLEIEEPEESSPATIAVMHDNVDLYRSILRLRFYTDTYNAYVAILCYANSAFRYILFSQSQQLNLANATVVKKMIKAATLVDNNVALSYILDFSTTYEVACDELRDNIMLFDAPVCAAVVLTLVGQRYGTDVAGACQYLDVDDEESESSSESSEEEEEVVDEEEEEKLDYEDLPEYARYDRSDRAKADDLAFDIERKQVDEVDEDEEDEEKPEKSHEMFGDEIELVRPKVLVKNVKLFIKILSEWLELSRSTSPRVFKIITNKIRQEMHLSRSMGYVCNSVFDRFL